MIFKMIGLEQRKCSVCNSDKTYLNPKTSTLRWHRNKWKKIGWLCHKCYSKLSDRERNNRVKQYNDRL